MADENEIKLVVSATATSVQPAMKTAEDAVANGCARMAESLIKSGLSAKEASTALKDLGYTANEVKSALEGFKNKVDDVDDSLEKTTSHVNNARVAFSGLASDIGVTGNRALGAFIQQSALLGPALASIFPVVAAVSFFEILEAGYKKLIDTTSALAGWNKEAKQMNDLLLSINQKTVEFNANLEVEKLHLGSIGLKGVAADRAKETEAAAERAIRGKELNDALAREASIRTQLEGIKSKTTFVDEYGRVSQEIETTKKPSTDEAERLNKELQETIQLQERIKQQIQTINEVKIPESKKNTGVAEAEAAQKALENWAKEQDRLGKEQEHAALERAAAERREQEVKERADEEAARATQVAAEKDLREFQNAAVAKVKLIEQQGKDELQQIRQNADMQEAETKKRSKSGGGDAVKQQAFDAYRQEIASIQAMIAVEKQLQDTLKATGALEDDPKMVASFQRQQQLLQQMQVSWQRYEKVVTTTNDAAWKSFKASFDQISSNFNRNMISMMHEQESFGSAMKNVWNQIVDTVVGAMLKLAEQMIVGALLHKTIVDQTQLQNARDAAGSTYAQVAKIPYVGPFLAPEAAAAAFVAVMAFERGGIVPETNMALVHKNEMILPANISDAVQRAAAGGGMNSRSVTLHYAPTIHGGAGTTTDSLRSESQKMLTHVKREMRRLNHF